MAENTIELDFSVDKTIAGLSKLALELKGVKDAQKLFGDAAVDAYNKGIASSNSYRTRLGNMNVAIQQITKSTDNYSDELSILSRLEREATGQLKKFNDEGRDINVLSEELAIIRDRMRQIRAEQDRLNDSPLVPQIGGTQRLQYNSTQDVANINRTGSALTSLKGAFVGAAAVFGVGFGLQGIIQLGQEILATTGKFESFRAVLKNTFGSDLVATAQLDRLTEFAQKTPFQLDSLTSSFIQLTNSGLSPTNEDLTALGDLAASKGKDFAQLSMAVTDSLDDMKIRLREFGISIDTQGNKALVSLATSSGVVKVAVDNTREAVAKQVIEFGKLKSITGQMAAESKTLKGQISNLKDQFDGLLNQPRASAFFGEIIKGAADALQYVSRFVEETDFTPLVNAGKVLYEVMRQLLVNAIIPIFNALVDLLSPILNQLGRDLEASGGQVSVLTQLFQLLLSPITIVAKALENYLYYYRTVLDLLGVIDLDADAKAKKERARQQESEKFRKDIISQAIQDVTKVGKLKEDIEFQNNELADSIAAIDSEVNKVIDGQQKSLYINGQFIELVGNGYAAFRAKVEKAQAGIRKEISDNNKVLKELDSIADKDAKAKAEREKQKREQEAAAGERGRKEAIKNEQDKNAKLYQLREDLYNALLSLGDRYEKLLIDQAQGELRLKLEQDASQKEITKLEDTLKEKQALIDVTAKIGAAKLKEITQKELDALVKEQAKKVALNKDAAEQIQAIRDDSNAKYIASLVEFRNKKRVLDAEIAATLNQGVQPSNNVTGIIKAKLTELALVKNIEEAKLTAELQGIRESYKLLKDSDTEKRLELERQYAKISGLLIDNQLNQIAQESAIKTSDINLNKDYLNELGQLTLDGRKEINLIEKESLEESERLLIELLGLSNQELLLRGKTRDGVIAQLTATKLALTKNANDAKIINKQALDDKIAKIDAESELDKNAIISNQYFYDEKGKLTEASNKQLALLDIEALEAKLVIYEQLATLDKAQLSALGLSSDVIAANVSKIKATIENARQGLKASASGDDKLINFAKLLGIDNENQEAANDALGVFYENVKTIYTDLIDMQIEGNNRLLSSIDEAISESQERLQKQLELSQKGYANNYLAEKANIDKLNAQRRKAVEDRRKLEKQKTALDTVEQISSLITASANIYKSLSAAGPVGIGIAIATIAAMFGAFVIQKAKAAQLSGTQQFMEGGYTGDGKKTDEAGIVHRGEFVSTADVTARNRILLEGLHSNDNSQILRGINNLFASGLLRTNTQQLTELRLPNIRRLTNSVIEKETERLLERIAKSSERTAMETEKVADNTNSLVTKTEEKVYPSKNGYTVVTHNRSKTVTYTD